MIKRAEDAFARGELLNEFIPVPADLKDTVSGFHGDPDEQAKLEEQTKANLEKYGYGNWYDFCVGEWGTKWDVGDSSGINDVQANEIVLYFDSAWSPPIAAYEKLEDLGFYVHAMYYEPGMCFAGIYDECGDESYDLTNMDSADVSDTIPTELDDAFGISETMADYEAEEQDEVTTWYKDGVEETGLEPHKVDPKLK
jgi:hypothetical protein